MAVAMATIVVRPRRNAKRGEGCRCMGTSRVLWAGPSPSLADLPTAGSRPVWNGASLSGLGPRGEGVGDRTGPSQVGMLDAAELQRDRGYGAPALIAWRS